MLSDRLARLEMRRVWEGPLTSRHTNPLIDLLVLSDRLARLEMRRAWEGSLTSRHTNSTQGGGGRHPGHPREPRLAPRPAVVRAGAVEGLDGGVMGTSRSRFDCLPHRDSSYPGVVQRAPRALGDSHDRRAALLRQAWEGFGTLAQPPLPGEVACDGRVSPVLHAMLCHRGKAQPSPPALPTVLRWRRLSRWLAPSPLTTPRQRSQLTAPPVLIAPTPHRP